MPLSSSYFRGKGSLSRYLHYSCGCNYASLDGKIEIFCIRLCDSHKQQVLSDQMKSLKGQKNSLQRVVLDKMGFDTDIRIL